MKIIRRIFCFRAPKYEKGELELPVRERKRATDLNVQYRDEDSLRTENESKIAPLAILAQNVY